MNPGYCKTSRGTGGDGHVNRLVQRRWIGKRGNWIDVCGLTSYEPETNGRIHPCICDHDKTAEAAIPLSATRTPAARFARDETRCHPYM
jgi:hypothetical protein